MRHFRLYVIGALVLFAAGLWAWNEIDLRVNYVTVTGTIVTTDQTCHLEKEDNAIIAKRKTTTNEVSCDLAQAAVNEAPEYKGFKVVPRTNIHYSYVSPVDHAPHTGDTWRDGTADRWPAPGAHVTIYASKAKAAGSKYVTR